jgi:hypothetical protein
MRVSHRNKQYLSAFISTLFTKLWVFILRSFELDRLLNIE